MQDESVFIRYIWGNQFLIYTCMLTQNGYTLKVVLVLNNILEKVNLIGNCAQIRIPNILISQQI